MQITSNILTPDTLRMLEAIAQAGSFAGAARQLGLVPSALTYRVRQIEDALDVLLFDRSARQAKPTEAGAELLREGGRLLQDIDAVATRRTREALTSGRADLAIGVSNIASDVAGLQQAPLGDLLFIYVVAPHHPLASMPEPITDAVMLRHRAVAVADSAQRGGMTMGLLGGQDVLTVDTMQAKVQVQLRGLGGGFLPEPMVRPYLEAGRLVAKRVARPERRLRLHYAWGGPGFTAPGRALQWWLQQLQSPTTRKALLENHHHF